MGSSATLALTRPIVGIENRTAQEVFDIMCDPEGINSRTTLFALRKSGLASVHYEGLREKWSISPAGRLALEKSK